MLVQLEHPIQPDVASLIVELDAYQDTLYPPEGRYALDMTSLNEKNLLFAVARDSNGIAIGCGALVLLGDIAELKRMYVRPLGRGKGVASSILKVLEHEAFNLGYSILKLETGPLQAEALAFYKKYGFETCGAFGGYPEHPLSVFMGKHLKNSSKDILDSLLARDCN